MIEQEAKTCLMYQKLKHFVNLFFTMEMTHVVTFTVDKILDKADIAQSFCHKFVQICLQKNEKFCSRTLAVPSPTAREAARLLQLPVMGTTSIVAALKLLQAAAMLVARVQLTRWSRKCFIVQVM